MSENELIEQFSEFGYYVMKHGTCYSVFDRRLARRTVEVNSLESLKDYAENIFLFPFMSETLEKTVTAFRDMFTPSPVTIPENLPEETVTGEEEVCDPDPEQEQESSPASPETETEDQGEPEPAEEPETDSPTLFTKICKGCGREFQTAHKQSMYCSPACYPSNKEKQSPSPDSPEKAVSVMQRPF